MATNSSTSTRAAACMECRLAKQKCIRPMDQGDNCARCTQHGFKCFVLNKRRGRKPKSRLLAHQNGRTGSQTQSGSDQGIPSLASNSHVDARSQVDFQAFNNNSDQQYAQPTLTAPTSSEIQSAVQADGSRTTTGWNAEALASALWADVHSKRRRRALPHLMVPFDIDSIDAPANGDTTITVVQGPKTLASILAPIGTRSAQTESTAPVWKPSDYSSDPALDPVAAGLLDLADAERLWDRYTRTGNRWVKLFDIVEDDCHAVRRRSTFLCTVILYLSARFADWKEGAEKSWLFISRSTSSQDNSEAWRMLKNALYARSRHLAAHAFFVGKCTLETAQAFLLLNMWRELDDSVSPLHFGFAARIAMDMRLGDSLPDLDDALDVTSRQRIRRHFHKRQETYLAMYSEDRMQSTLCVTGTTISDHASVLTDCTSPRSHDVHIEPQLRAMATARLLQDRYQQLIELHTSTDMLLHQLHVDLVDWHKEHAASDANQVLRSEEHSAQQIAVLGILGGTIMLHLASAVMKQVASKHGYASNQSSTHGVDVPSLSCIDSSKQILLSVLEIPPRLVRSLPDSLGLEVVHAARYLCYMICIYKSSELGASYLDDNMSLIQKVVDLFEKAVQHETDTISAYAKFLASLLQAAQSSNDMNDAYHPETNAIENGNAFEDDSNSMLRMAGFETNTETYYGDFFQDLLNFSDPGWTSSFLLGL